MSSTILPNNNRQTEALYTQLINLLSLTSISQNIDATGLKILDYGSVATDMMPHDFKRNLTDQINLEFQTIQPNEYLGKRAERLFKCFLKAHPRIELLKSNLQLISNKVTLGEIDFLLREVEKNEFFQLEFALKYYLQYEDRFIGPSAKDELARKIKRLKTHQLKVLSKNPTLIEDTLRRHYLPHYLIKGTLFYKYNSSLKTTSLNWWVFYKEAEKCISDEGTFSIIVKRNNWLYPMNYYDYNLTANEALEGIGEILKKERGVMVVKKEGRILSRGFVVDNEWPN